MRHIVLDTETTGFDPLTGHRIVEIGCVELINHIPSGKNFHHYLNPERDMPDEARRVHGLTSEFLADKAFFRDIASDFLEFIAEDPLVIHNAGFDMAFLNSELGTLGYPQLPMKRAIDTVALARKLFPGQPASLDALCKRFNIDTSHRTQHGALLDAQLLADVYLELTGGKQVGFDISFGGNAKNNHVNRPMREARSFNATPDEIAAHKAAVAKVKGSSWAE